MWFLLAIIINNTYYNYLMFSGTVMYGNMHSNVLLKVQCTPYKIVLQMHVLFELL